MIFMVICCSSYICNGCLSVSLVPAHYKGEEKVGKKCFNEIRAHTFGHGITEENLGKNNFYV